MYRRLGWNSRDVASHLQPSTSCSRRTYRTLAGILADFLRFPSFPLRPPSLTHLIAAAPWLPAFESVAIFLPSVCRKRYGKCKSNTRRRNVSFFPSLLYSLPSIIPWAGWVPPTLVFWPPPCKHYSIVSSLRDTYSRIFNSLYGGNYAQFSCLFALLIDLR
jgi:hypothetical protein